MIRKFFLTIVMSIPLAGAVASHIAAPVLIVMGILIFFVVSVASVRNEAGNEKPESKKS